MLELFAKMIKQREDSEKIYRDAGRPSWPAGGREIAIIREFLPKQLGEAEVEAAAHAAIAATGATREGHGQGDGGAERAHAGQMDFGKASAW